MNVSGTPRLLFVLDSANDTASSDSYAYYDASFDIGMYVRSSNPLLSRTSRSRSLNFGSKVTLQ